MSTSPGPDNKCQLVLDPLIIIYWGEGERLHSRTTRRNKQIYFLKSFLQVLNRQIAVEVHAHTHTHKLTHTHTQTHAGLDLDLLGP